MNEYTAPMLEKDRMCEPENIRLDCMITLAAEARGYMNPRWRPLLSGPLFDSFGWYDVSTCTKDESNDEQILFLLVLPITLTIAICTEGMAFSVALRIDVCLIQGVIITRARVYISRKKG